ncbi:MAG TPA: hypothetical protein VLB80_01915 [Candidatus Babeliales bacterium]|nr:hypothetical protein [Candidatus Babeliales bacterium]
MIEQIHKITQTLIRLNQQVNNKVLSLEDVNIIKSNYEHLLLIQHNIDELLHKFTLLPLTNADKIIPILINLHQAFSQISECCYILDTELIKFICTDEKQWSNFLTIAAKK